MNVKQWKYLLVAACLMSPLASGDIYKCTGQDGKHSFSDKPCPKDTVEEVGRSKNSDWVSVLRNEIPESIQIIDVANRDGNTIIKYSFKSPADSSKFMKLVSKLSNIPVELVSIKAQTDSDPGRAEIKVSLKSGPLADIIKQESKKESSFGFYKNERKSKDDYKHSKCINISTQRRQKLTYEESCKYSVSCPSEQSQEKTLMYCVESNISECFENKSWKSSNQLVGLPDSVEIGMLSQESRYKQGVTSGRTCAYYD